MSRRSVILAGFLIFILASAICFLVLQKQKSADPAKLKIVAVGGQTCLLSGQTAKVSSDKAIKFVDLPSDAKKRGQIIARVLSVKPFVVEVLDMEPLPSYSFDHLGIDEDLFISQSEAVTLQSLQFGDIISGDIYEFIYASYELAIGKAIKDINKLEKPIRYFNDSINAFANRSGTLIRYVPVTTNSNEFLLIFNDRKMYYRNNSNITYSDKELTEAQFQDLLKLFSSTNFDAKRSDFSVSRYQPSVSLACERYQPVSLERSSSQLRIITESLDSIIKNITAQ